MSEFHEIVLHGALGARFGASYKLAVRTPSEGVYALCLQIPFLAEAIEAGDFQCVVRTTESSERELGDIAEAHLPWRANETSFHIIPVLQGAGHGGGVAKIIIGAVMVIAAIVTWGAGLLPEATMVATGDGVSGAVATSAVTAGTATLTTMGSVASALGFSSVYGMIATMGVMIALGGLAQVLSPQKTKSTANNGSFVFNSLENLYQQGSPVPLIYGGPILVGSMVVGEGLTATDITEGVYISGPGINVNSIYGPVAKSS